MIPLVPPVALLLAKHPATEKFDLSSVKAIISSAAPLSLEIIKTIINKYKWEVLQGYGMTECTLSTHFMPPGQQKYGSVGKIMPFYEGKVRVLKIYKILNENLCTLKYPRSSIKVLERIWASIKLVKSAFEDSW